MCTSKIPCSIDDYDITYDIFLIYDIIYYITRSMVCPNLYYDYTPSGRSIDDCNIICSRGDMNFDLFLTKAILYIRFGGRGFVFAK